MKVVALDQPSETEKQRIGLMTGQIVVPDDFDRMGSDEIENLFGTGA